MEPAATGSGARGPDAGGASPAAPPRYPPVFYATLALIGLIEAWALYAADPDFFFPDLFCVPVIGICVVVGLSGKLRPAWLRIALLSVAFALPLLVLGFEYSQSRRHKSNASRMQFVEDRLLRYHYRPGATVDRLPSGAPLVVGDDWLDDVPHAIEKPADTYRVVILGDSVPNDPDVPITERIPRRLEAELAPLMPPGKRAEVINLSVEGYNTLQEVRLFERIGRRYRPDLVLVAYVLNDGWLQHPATGRVSNSFFFYRLLAVADWFKLRPFSNCTVSSYFDQPYTLDLIALNSFERLKIYADLDGFQVLVATMPIVERFDDRVCLRMYDAAIARAREVGFATTRVVDSFVGLDDKGFRKANWMRSDGTHPNAAGHALIARHLAKVLEPMLGSRPILPPMPPPAPHLETIPFK